jgi:hypothetical protein
MSVAAALLVLSSPGFAQESAPFNFGGRIVDKSNGTPVPGARVILELWTKVPPLTTFTTPSGLFSFSAVGQKNALSGRIIITKRNYDRTAVNVDVSSGKPPEIAINRQQLPSATVERRSGIARSQPIQSFPSANWSGWFPVCSNDDLKADEHITVASFRLVGDRQCASWGECRETVHTDRRVCWEFRVQGHNEWIFPRGSATTQGELSYEVVRTIV